MQLALLPNQQCMLADMHFSVYIRHHVAQLYNCHLPAMLQNICLELVYLYMFLGDQTSYSIACSQSFCETCNAW